LIIKRLSSIIKTVKYAVLLLFIIEGFLICMPISTSNKQKLTSEEIRHIADLARIELSAEEKEKYAKDLSQVLNYIDQLNEVDTKNISATNQVTGLINIVREDIVENCDEETRKKILGGAPMKEGDYVKVKAVL